MRRIVVTASFTFILASFCLPVAAQNHPVPFLNNPTVPAATVPGGPAFTLTVNGAGFVNGAAILWNGSPRTTMFISGSQLRATILASDIATASLASVTVSNPSPGGGVSNPVLFSVAAQSASVAFARSESTIPGGELSWVSQPTGLVAWSNPADGTPVLALADGKCPFLAFCNLNNGTIVKVGVLGLYSQNLVESPQTLVSGDFNGDDLLDVLTVGQLGPGPTIPPNANLYAVVSPNVPPGTGFLPVNEYPLPSGANVSPAPVVGDFNRDGHLDVVIGGQSAIYFVPGNGDGTLGTAVSSNTESSTEGGLVSGDFNGDGILDLAVTNVLLNSASILIGNGDGTFKTPVDYATGSSPGRIVAGDFNADGNLDLAILDGSWTTVSILLGNGDGTFKAKVEYPVGISAFSLTLGDYNADGILDIAVSDTQCTNIGCPASGSVNFLLGNGDGTFQGHVDFAAGGEPEFIATTGIGLDSLASIGRAGTAVVNYLDNTVSIFSPQAVQGGNPSPAVASISPLNAIQGSGSFTLTVNGSNFISSSTIGFGGQVEPTTFVSGSQLTAAIPGSAIANAGDVVVLVVTPGPGGGEASAVFSVLLLSPTISSITPSSAIVGSPGFTLTVNGTNFANGSTVSFNGVSRPATFISSSQISIPVSSSDVMNQGTISISVTNPFGTNNGGGGTSSSLSLTILPTNAQPAIGALMPTGALAGGPSFPLQITGTGFGSSSTVNFGSNAVTSTYVNPTTLQASISASAIAVAGTPLVTVANPGGSAATGFAFIVRNPVPDVGNLQPGSIPAGNSSTELHVTGVNFVQTSVVQVNGSARPTTYVSAGTVIATLPATDFARSGTLSITVNSPAPGGGTTSGLALIVTDFNVSAASSSDSVTAGQVANYNLSLVAINGILGEAVTFSASGLPSGASAAFTPPNLPVGNSSTSVVLSITTTSHSVASILKFPRGMRPDGLSMYRSALVFVICFVLWLFHGLPRLPVPRLLIILLIAVVAGLAACGSNNASPSAQTNPATGTPAGTYTVRVNAASSNSNVSTTVTLTVM